MKTLVLLLLLGTRMIQAHLEQVLGTNERLENQDGTLFFHKGKCGIMLQDNGKVFTSVNKDVNPFWKSNIMWDSGDPTPTVECKGSNAICKDVYDPVICPDGCTYSNECFAMGAGYAKGECISGTSTANYKMEMQGDGNLVIRHPDTNQVVYSTHTNGPASDYFLAFHDDCVLAIYQGLFEDPNPKLIWQNKREEFKRGDRLGKGDIFNVIHTDKFLYVQPSDGNLLVNQAQEGDLRTVYDMKVLWASNDLPNAGTKDYYLKATNNGHLTMVGIEYDGTEYVYWDKDLGVGNDCYRVGLNENNEPIALQCPNIEQVLGTNEFLESIDGNVFFHEGRCRVYLQTNGKFVTAVGDRGKRIWQSGDPKFAVGYPQPNMRITMQEDGNLVVRAPAGVRGAVDTVYYATHSNGPIDDYFLGIDDNCAVAIYRHKITDYPFPEPFPEPIWKSVRTELRRGDRLGKAEILCFPEKDAYMVIQHADGHLTVRTGENLSGDDVVVWASSAVVDFDTKDYFLKANTNGHLTMVGMGDPDFEYWDMDLGVGEDCYIVKLNNNYEPVAVAC